MENWSQNIQQGNIRLLDIIDLEFLQKFQDVFAKAANVASLMVDDKGPITKPSNFTDFCSKYTRCSDEGCKRCNECDIRNGSIASKQGKPVIYSCHLGLTDFAVPIMVNGKHVASILGGQILTQMPKEDDFRKLAIELGIDEQKYIYALRKIKIIPYEQVQAAADLLFVVANFISEMANKNLELIQKSQKEKINADKEILLRKISENIRSSLDIDKTLSYICDELAQAFKVQRATIIQYHDSNNYSKFEVRREYKSDPTIRGILNNPSFNFQVGEVWAKALEGDGNYLAFDNIEESDAPEFFKKNYAEIGQKSIVIAPIEKDSRKWGVIILSEYQYYRNWTEEDISLLKIISNQIYIAIQQSELYLTIQKKANNENVLRKIMSSYVNDFNAKNIINSLVSETCNLFEADRCLFIGYEAESDSLRTHAEYAYSKETYSKMPNTLEKPIVEALVSIIKQRKILVSNPVINDETLAKIQKTLRDKIRLNSFIIVPIHYGEINYGVITLQYMNIDKYFNDDDIALLTTIANQTAVVLHQAQLYKEIKENEKYTRTVLNSIQDGILTTDDNFIIESCNPAIENICGYKPSECIGKPLGLILDYEREKNGLKSKLLYGVMKNGHRFPAEVSLSKIITDDRKLNLVVLRDITERKKVEQMKNEFVSTVSHELRTPLTSMRGSLGLVLSGTLGTLSDKIKTMLEIANSNCLRLIDLINDILDIEKIEAGKMDFEIKSVEVMSLVEHVIQANLHYAQKFGVEIKLINHLSGQEFFVKADMNRLNQVITNLLSNAIKFAESTLPVEINVSKSLGNVKVSITNYGPEIPKEFRDRMFQKFAQADSSDARKKGGTGLGLSICKAIVEKMHGNIDFKSENNKTVFYFELPEDLQSINIKGFDSADTKS